MNNENKHDALNSLFAGFIVGIITIICYYLAFSIGNFLLGKEHYAETMMLMIMLSISSGTHYVLSGSKPAKDLPAMVVFFMTLYAASYLIDVFEIYIFAVITIITATLLRILLWREIKRIACDANRLSEK